MLENYRAGIELINAFEDKKFIMEIVGDSKVRAHVKFDSRLPVHFQKLAEAVDNSLYKIKKSCLLEVLNNSLKNPGYAKEFLEESNNSLPEWLQITLKSLSFAE